MYMPASAVRKTKEPITMKANGLYLGQLAHSGCEKVHVILLSVVRNQPQHREKNKSRKCDSVENTEYEHTS